MKQRKLTYTDKQLIKQYIEPHTDIEASRKFKVPVTVVRAVMKTGVVIRKPVLFKFASPTTGRVRKR